jgi:type II secretory pathway pseudopilin PulG
MARKRQQHGFSLTETLMAVGTLAIGMTFIAGTFLTGIVFSTLSTERTIGAVAAEEAFAKVRIYGLDPGHASLTTSGFVAYEDLMTVPAEESRYPSIRKEGARQYSWAAICRRVADSNDLVQITVFVSRETGGNPSYWKRKTGTGWPQLEISGLPRPVRINVAQVSTPAALDEIAIQDAVADDAIDERTFVNEGSLLVDDATGQIYRVLERSTVALDTVRLDRPWEGGDLTSASGGWVWAVPPGTTGGRIPGVAVYQKIIRFPRP